MKGMIHINRHVMKGVVVLLLSLFTFHLSPLQAGTNLQLYYDFGSLGTACPNQRSNRVTTTLELFYPDPWGNTFAFIDLDYAIHPEDPHNTPFLAYTEIARCLNFWGDTKAKNLSIQVEYNGGLGLYRLGNELRGYGINHAALVGLNYCLHTADYKNIFNLELLYMYFCAASHPRGVVPVIFLKILLNVEALRNPHALAMSSCLALRLLSMYCCAYSILSEFTRSGKPWLYVLFTSLLIYVLLL